MKAAVVVLASVVAIGWPASAAAERHAPPVRVVPSTCSDDNPCVLHAGTYRLSSYVGVLGGLEVTVPVGWVSPEDSVHEFALRPSGHPSERLTVWLDISAVKSSGRGHGTVLGNVGTTASALIEWFTHDRDFQVVAKPAPATIGRNIAATTFAMGVSTAAKYGDRACPTNPRCADITTWKGGDTFSIGGNEQVRLYLAPIKSNGTIPHTLTVALDAPNHAQLVQLTNAALSIIGSIRLPAGITGG